MRNFRTYELAVAFYKAIQGINVPGHLRNQLQRASSSIVLNLAEGYGKFSRAEQRRFFQISFGSVREVQAIFDLIDAGSYPKQRLMLDQTAASLYKLMRTGL